MNIIELKNDEINLHIKITVPYNDINSAIHNKCLTIANKTKIPGFRLGKTPISLIQRKYPSIKTDVIREKINDIVNTIIKEKQIQLVNIPKVEHLSDKNNKDFKFLVKFELQPKITLPNLKDISLEKPILDIEDKDIDFELQKLAYSAREYPTKTFSQIKEGDKIIIDSIGHTENYNNKVIKLDNFQIIIDKNNKYFNNCGEKLINHKIGDIVKIQIPIPKDYPVKSLIGKIARLEAKIKEVYNPVIPKIDDDLAKKFKNENLTQLKDKVKNNINKNFDNAINNFIKIKLYDYLEQVLNFPVPQSMLDIELTTIKQKNHQKTVEELANNSNLELDQYYKKLSLRRVRIALMIREYANINNIKVNEEEIKNAILHQTQIYPGYEQQVIDFYTKNKDQITSLQLVILEEKVIKNIIDNEILLQEKTYKKNELEQLLQTL